MEQHHDEDVLGWVQLADGRRRLSSVMCKCRVGAAIRDIESCNGCAVLTHEFV